MGGLTCEFIINKSYEYTTELETNILISDSLRQIKARTETMQLYVLSHLNLVLILEYAELHLIYSVCLDVVVH
jgi:hypothetical protein